MRDGAIAAAEAVAKMPVEPRGTLRLSCPVALAQSTLGYLVPRYLALHPHVKLDLLVTNRVVDLIEEGIDIALRVRSTPSSRSVAVRCQRCAAFSTSWERTFREASCAEAGLRMTDCACRVLLV